MTTPLMTIELPGLRKWKSGKVREVFEADEHLLVVATDRISAFDCVLPTGIPYKGEVLNRLSAWWFRKLESVIPNHLISIEPEAWPEKLKPHAERLRGRAMLVRRARILPVECIVRGYLIGSGWKDYQRTGSVCGIRLRPGYRQADRLDEPIFTPSTKAEAGHDINISFEEMQQRIGVERAARIREVSLTLYREAAEYALRRGIIIADTKFEFGLCDGELVLADEALTPDSSRFWPADQYAPGGSPPSFDKQYVRDYLESLPWDKKPPAPPLPDEVVRRTSEKYLEAFRRLTGQALSTGDLTP